MSTSKSTDIIARLKQVTATRTDISLSTRLGVSPQTLSSWKGRERMPYSICIDLAAQYGVSLDWLLTGIGPVQRPTTAEPASAQLPTCAEQQLLTTFRALTAADQQFVQHTAQERQRLRDLEQRLDALYSQGCVGPKP